MRLEMRERHVCRTCGVLGSSLSLLRRAATLWGPAQALHPRGSNQPVVLTPFHPAESAACIVRNRPLISNQTAAGAGKEARSVDLHFG